MRLPMLLAPVLTAVAVGFAASVGQYLPTLLVGGGRLSTLTTEAVALAAGATAARLGFMAWPKLLPRSCRLQRHFCFLRSFGVTVGGCLMPDFYARKGHLK